MEVPAHVEQLLAALRAGGFVACPVGGCVRDSLLGRAPGDWDLCTSARPEQVKACAAPRWRTLDTGIAHGTVTVLTGDGPVEVTTFRVEGGYSDHRRPDGVRFVADLEEDLARRDFTINAMALDEAAAWTPSEAGRTCRRGSSAAWASPRADVRRPRCAFCGRCALPPAWIFPSCRPPWPPPAPPRPP